MNQGYFAGGLLGMLLAIMVAMAAGADDGGRGASFPQLCGQYPGVLVESTAITVSGAVDEQEIAVVNGEYSINGSPYTMRPGTVRFGETVTVRHYSASGSETYNTTQLTIGEQRLLFTSSTEPCLRGTQ